MRDSEQELRDELMALLAASEELPADTREHLVEGFLTKLELDRPRRWQGERLRSAYHTVIPLSLPATSGIALAHGLILFALGHYLLDTVMGLPTYAQAYMPAWIVLGALWLVETVITLLVVSVLIRQRRPKTDLRPGRIAAIKL